MRKINPKDYNFYDFVDIYDKVKYKNFAQSRYI